MLYGQGGVAWRHDNFNFATTPNITTVPPGTTLLTGPITSFGWTVGAGAEWMFLPNLSVFIEYDFFNFGASQNTFTSPLVPGVPFTLSAASQNINLVMLGLNYRFHLSGFNRN